MLGEDGKVIDARIFHAIAPSTTTEAAAAAAALDEAFRKTAVDLVVWVAAII
jgi:ABC-type uncharacterized transport system auxiliary subunit